MFRVHLLRTAKKKRCHWPTAASGQLSAHDCEHAPFMPTQSSRAWNSYREIHPCKLHHSPHRTAWNLCLARVCGSWMTIVEFIEIQGEKKQHRYFLPYPLHAYEVAFIRPSTTSFRMVKSTSSWVFDSLLTLSSVKSWNSPTLQSSDPSGENLEPSSLVVFCEVQPALTPHWLPRCRPCGTTWVDRFSYCPRPLRGHKKPSPDSQFPTLLFLVRFPVGFSGGPTYLWPFLGPLSNHHPKNTEKPEVRIWQSMFRWGFSQKKKSRKLFILFTPKKKCASQKCAKPHKKQTSQAFLVSTIVFFSRFCWCEAWLGMTCCQRRFRFRQRLGNLTS